MREQMERTANEILKGADYSRSQDIRGRIEWDLRAFLDSLFDKYYENFENKEDFDEYLVVNFDIRL